MKTHYHPWDFYGDDDRAPCGTFFGEYSNVTGVWERVTCGHCIRRKKRIMGILQDEEKAIVEQMGSMADFMSNQNEIVES